MSVSGNWVRRGSTILVYNVDGEHDSPQGEIQQFLRPFWGRGPIFPAKPSRPPGGSTPSPSIIVEPDPQPGDYADTARQILRQSRPRRKRDRAEGIVLSVMQLVPAEGKPMIDTRTEGTWRPRLTNPPAHVVLPAEVYEIK
jgi:hypothetical protein